MFPYKDENPTERPAVITIAIIIANALAFILVQGAGAQGPLVHSVCNLGLIPAEVLHSVKPGSGVELAPGITAWSTRRRSTGPCSPRCSCTVAGCT